MKYVTIFLASSHQKHRRRPGYINGFPPDSYREGGSGTVGNYTMYVNPFMVVQNFKNTKHFYIEGQRIVSKLGEMGIEQQLLLPKSHAGDSTKNPVQWDTKKDLTKDIIIANFEALGLNGAVFTAGKSGKMPYGQIKKYFRGNDVVINPGTPTSLTTQKTEDLQFYYHPDHLGSSNYITDASGEVYQHQEYFPFGEMFVEERNDAEYTTYLFNGKELDEETGLYYYGARYYDPRTSLWQSVDPKAEKYYYISSFAYCLNNPVYFIDSEGKEVKPGGDAELKMIQNTLPKDARDYVKLDKNGFIDRKLLNSYGGESLNFNNLKTMVNSDKIVEVLLDNKFTFKGQDGQLGTAKMSYFAFDSKYDSEADKDLTGETIGGLSTGENGFLGKTLFPDKEGIQNSPNGNIFVIVNKNLSPEGAAEIYSHEANGHALLYILNGGNHKGASHQPVNGKWIEGNKTLMEMIINSKKETIKNMQEQ